MLWLLSRVLENNFCWRLQAGNPLAGPAVVSLLAKDKKLHHLIAQTSRTPLTLSWPPSPVAANYSTQYPDSHPSNKSAW
ncbi:hypothetical protein DMI69_23630 [Escherichia coli]|nr:hypothetical protein [Escherichia coli]